MALYCCYSWPGAQVAGTGIRERSQTSRSSGVDKRMWLHPCLCTRGRKWEVQPRRCQHRPSSLDVCKHLSQSSAGHIPQFCRHRFRVECVNHPLRDTTGLRTCSILFVFRFASESFWCRFLNRAVSTIKVFLSSLKAGSEKHTSIVSGTFARAFNIAACIPTRRERLKYEGEGDRKFSCVFNLPP